jgi:hypothetical protein
VTSAGRLIVASVTNPVSKSEIDYKNHDPYLSVISDHAEIVGEAMLATSQAAATFLKSRDPDDLPAAADAFAAVADSAASFETALDGVTCPAYLKGADADTREAIETMVNAGRRGAEGTRVHDPGRIDSAASMLDDAADEIRAVSGRITDWRSGAARPQ